MNLGNAIGVVILIVLMLLALYVYLVIFIAKCFRDAAADKGYHSIRYFLIPLFFGVVGYILVAALPDRNQQKQSTQQSKYTVTCPTCKKRIEVLPGTSGIRCDNCKTEF